MYTESTCRFCAKLPVTHNLRLGSPTRCPLCKGQLVEDREAGATYRYEDQPEGPPRAQSLGRRLAVFLGISTAAILIWLLVKPQAPPTAVAAQSKPKVEAIMAVEEIAPPEQTSGVLKTSEVLPVYAAAKSGPGATEIRTSAKPAAGGLDTPGKPYMLIATAKDRPIYADGFYSRAKEWAYKFEPPPSDPGRPAWPALSEKELLDRLKAVPQLTVKSPSKVKEEKTAEKKAKKQDKLDHATYLGELKKQNPNAAGLPFLLADCQLSTEAAIEFDGQVRAIRSSLESLLSSKNTEVKLLMEGKYPESFTGPSQPSGKEPTLSQEEAAAVSQRVAETLKFHLRKGIINNSILERAQAVNPLQQLIMDQPKAFRRMLVYSLDEIGDRKATVALARRALFDFDAENRYAAVRSLSRRSAGDFTPVLLEGLRYPWPAVQHNAARALKVCRANPQSPNCWTCWTKTNRKLPSRKKARRKFASWCGSITIEIAYCVTLRRSRARDRVRATVPSPDQPLPPRFSTRYYDDDLGNSSFVRADVTYLRQDFSAQMEVTDHGPWPALQRYDFLVRVRELTKEELASLEKKDPKPSEYRKAILSVLQELTGMDAGITSDAWRKRLGLAAVAK